MTVEKELKLKNIFTEVINDNHKSILKLLEYIDFNKIIESDGKVIDTSNLKPFLNFEELLKHVKETNDEVSDIMLNIARLFLDESFIDYFKNQIKYAFKINNLGE